MAPDRTGLLIIRAWIEPHPTAPFRATVRQTTDLEAGLQHTARLSSTESVEAVVREWLRHFEGAADADSDESDLDPSAPG